MAWTLAEGTTDCRALIDGHLAVDHADSIESVGQLLDRHGEAYAAVCRDDRVIGVCSRSRIRRLLGGRYGFALHNRRPVGEALTGDTLIVRFDLSLRDLLRAALARPGDAFYRAVAVTGTRGEFLGLISTRRLVTAQSSLVEEQFSSLANSLARQHELERAAIEREKLTLLETMAGGIAHEINNKLQPIVAYAELLAEDADLVTVDTIRAAAQSVLRSALESSRIVSQLLALSRPPRSELGPCDLREVVEQSLTLAALRAKGTGIRMDSRLPAEPAMVMADTGQLKQVVMNLLVNAIDAAEGQSNPVVTVTVSGTEDGAAVEVRDTGIGIAPEHLSRVFDPFFTTKSPGRGTGLGLGVCAAILRQHGTAMEVESTPGAGARFRFTLPRLHDVAPPAAVTGAPTSAPCGPARVLVVDDDPAVRGVIGNSLRHLLGCAVDQARDGREGQAALSRIAYEAVLCDVRMPGMNGVDLVRWLSTQARQPAPRAILMTGDGGDALWREMRDTGAMVIRKPFTMNRLVDVLLDRPTTSAA